MNELDECIEATDELIRSLSLCLNNETSGEHYKVTSVVDNTSFGINFQNILTYLFYHLKSIMILK